MTMDGSNLTAEETAVAAVNVTGSETSSPPVRLGDDERVRARRRSRRSPVRWARNGGLTTLVFALPMLLVFGAFSWYPMVRLVLMSVQKTNLFAPAIWVGLDNFRSVLSDPLLPVAVKNTGYFALLALIFGYPIPLLAAVLMSEARRFRGIFSFLAYLPVVLPPVVAVLLWKVFYDGGPNGVFNTILGAVHLGPYQWLSDQQMAMPSLVLESTWANAGTTIIIYLAALTAVNSDLYEAASVDGASIWRKVWHITMPQLRGVMLVTFMLQIIGTAQVFIEPFLFTSGGPANATLTVLLLIYQYAFGNSLGASYGEAAALSVMLAGSLAVFSVVFMRITRSWSSA
jgi:multiple sugar transport system permease protein